MRRAARQLSPSRSAASPGASRSMIDVIQHNVCAPSPPSPGGEGWGEGVHPRVICSWKRPSPRPSSRKRGEREREQCALLLCTLLLLSPLPASAQTQPRQTLTIGYVEIANDQRYEPIRGADRIVLKQRAHP